jgi:hypothetical protein
MKHIDFFATWPHYIDHMLPIYKALGEQAGDFYVPAHLRSYLEMRGVNPTAAKNRLAANPMDVVPLGKNPILVAATGDLQKAWKENRDRKIILMEHGVGIVFPHNHSYAGNIGARKLAALTLAPNEFVRSRTAEVLPNMPQRIIGTPKLDKFVQYAPRELPNIPTVAISFHWDGSQVAPEAGNAFRYYRGILPLLNEYRGFNLVAHCHPRSRGAMESVFGSLRIEYIDDFEDVMTGADLLINDCSSIMYEFLVTGKPVIILNAPWFRRNADFGVRFWKYTDIGEQVNTPEELLPAIHRTFSNLEAKRFERSVAIQDLYPHLGDSARVAAQAILDFFGG